MFVLSIQGTLETKNALGIMYRHAYSLTAVEKVSVPKRAELVSAQILIESISSKYFC